MQQWAEMGQKVDFRQVTWNDAITAPGLNNFTCPADCVDKKCRSALC